MAGKMRIHELAKEIGKSSREIVTLLNEMGIPVLSHANTVDDEAIAKVKEKIAAAKKPTTKLIKKKKEEPLEEIAAQSRTIKGEAHEEIERNVELPEAALKEEEDKGLTKASFEEQKLLEIQARIETEQSFIDYSPALIDTYYAPEIQKEMIEEKKKIPVPVAEEKPPVEKIIEPESVSRKKKKGLRKEEEEEEELIHDEIITPSVVAEIKIPEGITLRGLAQRIGVKSKHMLKRLLEKGYLASINQSLTGEMAIEIARDFGCNATLISYEEEILKEEEEGTRETPGMLQARPPVVTIMGHVDHGKTTLLDFIRKTNVAAKEVGGITQHVGAHRAFYNDRTIVFLDTPGHEAFTKIRARGAKATDIVILVIAAEDGVMPQTLEAINHAKLAGATMVVAINKIDKPNANIERVKKQLSDAGLVVEEWGGTTIAIPISAKTGAHVNELLEMLLLVADLLDLKANPDKIAQGVIVESRLDPHKGPVATVLIQDGTLHKGDVFIAGCSFGKVKAMYDDLLKKVNEAPPSCPVEVLGFDTLPEAGDFFQVVKNEAKARSVVTYRKTLKKDKLLAKGAEQLSLEHLYSKIKEGLIKEFPIIIKADVHGSIEALLHELSKIKSSEVQVKIIHNGIGGINYSDVLLAEASGAIIIGFNVRAEAKARELAEREKVEIRYYNIIYNFLEEIQKALIGMLESEYKENIMGTADVRKVFRISKTGTIAGCYVSSGKIQRNAKVRLIRDHVVIFDGKINTLKRFKDDASEVLAGYECGLSFLGYNDIEENDTIEAYTVQEIRPKSL
jgi:translation initiation factor IF-2